MNPKDYKCNKNDNIKTFTFPLSIDLDIEWIAEVIEEDIAERLADELSLQASDIKDEWADKVLRAVIDELQNRIEKRGN